MVSLPTGSDKLLVISTAFVDFIIKAKEKQTADNLHSTTQSTLRINGSNINHISIPAKSLSEEYFDCEGMSIHELNIEPLFFEQTDYYCIIESRNNERLRFHSNSSHVTESIGTVRDNDDTLLSGVINYGNNVGFSDYYIYANNKLVLRITLEVFPSKVSYREDYREMMDDINKIVSDSALDFLRKTYQVFVPNHKKNDVPAVFFTVLRTVYDKFIMAINRILSAPNHRLITEYSVVPFHKAKKADSKTIRWVLKNQRRTKHNQNSSFPEQLFAPQKRITFDTQENRLIKHMICSIISKLDDFIYRYKRSAIEPEGNIILEAKKMTVQLQRFLSNSFLCDVTSIHTIQSMSLVFGLAPGYREIYKYYLILQNGFTVGGEVFHMSVRETAQLYEYWCFIKLYTILKSAENDNKEAKYSLLSADIIKVDRSGITVSLSKGKSSSISFINNKTGERISLTYNPSESKTQTVNQRPDNVLELEKKGAKTTYKYIFDAKYRIERNPDRSFYPDSKPGPKVDDINTMHRYRDSIVYESTDSRFIFEKTMFGAYILFPYSDDEEEYRSHRFYKSIDSVNIGGLPFLPSKTTLVTELLEALIADSSDSAFERATLPIGIEERLKTVDWRKRDVLIGLVTDAEHFNIFKENRIYFTRRFDSHKLPIRYIALYEKSKGIRYFGECIGYRKAGRASLPGKSVHNEEYHVFEILNWTELPSIITAEGPGPRPIAYTNFFLLSESALCSELRLKTEEEYRLYTELKRVLDTRIIDEGSESIAFEVGDTKVVFEESKIVFINADRVIPPLSIDAFKKRPGTSFRILLKNIRAGLQP